MIRYFLGRELAGKLGIPLARWKRWSREFLPPDPLGGLQSGYARHYSINEAFTVYLAGHLVSRSRFSIPEARAILSDLEHWLAEEGYRIGASAAKSGENVDPTIVREHRIIVYPQPVDGDRPSGFGYSIRGILAHRQYTQQGRQIEEERFVGVRLGIAESPAGNQEALELKMILITRILRHFTGCLELNPHLFSALRHEPGMD